MHYDFVLRIVLGQDYLACYISGLFDQRILFGKCYFLRHTLEILALRDAWISDRVEGTEPGRRHGDKTALFDQ